MVLSLNPSNNVPTERLFSRETNNSFSDYTEITEIVDKKYFLPSKNESIVDNEDSECVIPISSWSKIKKYFMRERSLPSYKGEYYLTNPPLNWETVLLPDAYGSLVKSAICCAAGKRNVTKVGWQVKLEKEGIYEVFAYIPARITLRDKKTFHLQKEVMQTYIVSHENNKEEKTEINIFNRQGWISLGKYHFLPGNHTVTLTNEGEPSQCIIGDAVKWVYQIE